MQRRNPRPLLERGFLSITLNQRRSSGFLRSIHISRKSGLGLLDDGLEGLRIRDGQLGESATIQFDASEVQALDEAVVGDALSADSSIDALDPQLAEVALASLTIAEVVSKGVKQLLLGLTVQAGALAAVAGSLSRTTRRFLWAFTARLTRAIFDSSAFY